MQDLRFYHPILKLIERAFSPYSKNIRAILILIIVLTASKKAGRFLLFLATGSMSFSLAVSRSIFEKGGLLTPFGFSIIFIVVTLLLVVAWLIATFSITRHFKVGHVFTSKEILPFFGLLNLFVFYAIIGGSAALYNVLIVFIISTFVYHKRVFVKKMNYRGKEFVFWNLYPVAADKLLFPVEDSDRLKKYKITLQDDTRNAIVSPNDSGFFSKPIQVSKGDRLVFSIGLAERAFSGMCVFEIYASVDCGHEEKIFGHHLSPATKMVDQTWKEFQIDLTSYDKKELVLRFKARSENKKQPIDAYWGFPKIMHNKETMVSTSSPCPDIENIIILLLDGARADLFDRASSIKEGIPNILDFFSKNSINCSKAIAQNDWTSPAFASIFSGRYAAHHQHFVSSPLSYRRPMSSNLQWLPEILREQGYLTCAFSNYYGINPSYGFAKGFDSFYNGGNIEEIDYGEKVSLHGLRFLRENEGRKKFLFLHYFTTHRPFKTRYPYRVSSNPNFSNWFNHERYSSFIHTPYERLSQEDRQAIVDIYCNAIVQIDRELSIIFDYLIAKQQADRSLIILTTDHGYTLFDRDSFSPKVTGPYEGIIRIPFLARMPKELLKNESPKVIDALIEANIDIFPTVLDAIGLKEMSSLDGQSLLKLVKGDVSPRKHTISELYDTKSNTYMLAIRGERYKFISTYNFDASKPFTFKTAKRTGEMFFDLFTDSGEKKDISKEKEELLPGYRKIEEAFSSLHK